MNRRPEMVISPPKSGGEFARPAYSDPLYDRAFAVQLSAGFSSMRSIARTEYERFSGSSFSPSCFSSAANNEVPPTGSEFAGPPNGLQPAGPAGWLGGI